jgi:hypothetical protein
MHELEYLARIIVGKIRAFLPGIDHREPGIARGRVGKRD